MTYPLPADIARYVRADGKPTPDFYRWLKQLDSYATGTAIGIPDGGTDGQALLKQSGADGDADWETLTKAMVGLADADNTSDVDKPVSTAQAAAIAEAISDHEAETDPHPQYLTAAEGNAAYQPLDSDLTAFAAKTAPTGAVVGTTDAQALTNKDLTSGTNTFPTFNQNTTGNAATATKLQTARNIDGQSFDGSANITVIAPGTHAATSKTTPVDADELPLVDSAASNVLKKLTWANLKATLKTYFDTLYRAVGTAISLTADVTGQLPLANIASIANNTILGNASGSSAAPSALSVGSWTAYTPSVVSTSGTFTSVSATGAYLQIGKLTFFQLIVTITTNGTAAGVVNASLPFNAARNCTFAGRANSVSGKMLQCSTSTGSTNLFIRNYDNTYPGATGETLIVCGFYEAQ